jgi:hypothetical protein
MTTPLPDPELLNDLSKRFAFHGTNIYGTEDAANRSPLYMHLSLAIANDRELLALAAGQIERSKSRTCFLARFIIFCSAAYSTN